MREKKASIRPPEPLRAFSIHFVFSSCSLLYFQVFFVLFETTFFLSSPSTFWFGEVLSPSSMAPPMGVAIVIHALCVGIFFFCSLQIRAIVELIRKRTRFFSVKVLSAFFCLLCKSCVLHLFPFFIHAFSGMDFKNNKKYSINGCVHNCPAKICPK